MSEDIATIGVKADTTQVDNLNKSLDKLSDSGKKSGASALIAETSWGRYAASLLNPTTAAIALGTAIVGIGTKAIISAEDARISVAKMELIYKNSGKNIGVSLKEIESEIQGLAQTTIFDDDSLRDASREFVKFGNITGDTLKSLIKTTTEYARLTDQDVVSAAHAMAKALADPEAASRLLKEAGVKLTNTEQEYIKVLIDSNRESEAQAILAEKLGKTYNGAAEALTGLHSEAEMTKNAIGELFEAIGNSAVAQAGLSALESSLQFIRGLVISTTNAFSGAAQSGGASESFGRGASDSWGDPVASSQKNEAQMKKEIEAYKALGKASSGHHAARAAGISNEQKAMNSLNNEFKSMIENMEKEYAIGLLSGDDAKIAALDYDLETGSLRKLDEARKNHLRTLQLDIINRETEKKGNEALADELAALTDEYNKLTLSARDYYSLTLTTKGIAPNQQGDLLANFDKNQAADLQKQKIDDANASLKSYIESLDKAKTGISDLGSVTSAVFDGALGGVSTLTGVFASMSEQITANTAALVENRLQMEEASKAPIKNMEGILKINKEKNRLEKEGTTLAIDGARQAAGAASKMFGEKSSAAKSFHAIEVALSVATIAMRAKEIASTLAATAVSVAGGAAKMFSQSGWFGFAGVAAMLAVMVGLGFSRGGSSSAASIPSDTGTGTVLGDKDAVSESTSKTYQLLKDIHAEEYAELRGINSGVAKLNGDIVNTVTKVFQSGGINAAAIGGLGKKTNDPLQLPDPLGLGKFVFGETKKEITEVGILIGKTAIDKVLNGREVSAKQFTTVKTTSTGFFGMGKSESFSDTFSPLDKGVKGALTQVFRSVGNTMQELSVVLGGDVRKYVIPAMKIDIKGLNAEEASKKISGVISAQMDRMALRVFGGTIKQYQQLGEGLFETAVRIVAQVAVVRDAVGKSGLNIESNAIGIADALVKAAGGLQEFQKQFATYFDKFYSETEKQARLQAQLAGQLGAVGLALPATRDGYRKQVEALNLNTKAGQAQYSMLIKLAGAADTYYTQLGQAQTDNIKNIQAIIDALRAGSKTLLESLTGLRQERSQAKNFLFGQLGLLNSGQGELLDGAGINSAIGTLTKPSEQLFRTVLDFQRETVRASDLFSTFADRAEAQKTIWQQQLDVLVGIRVEVAAQRAAVDETARTSRKVSDLLTRVTRDGDALVTVAA